MTITEIMDMLKEILEVLDKIYHATIGEEKEDDESSE